MLAVWKVESDVRARASVFHTGHIPRMYGTYFPAGMYWATAGPLRLANSAELPLHLSRCVTRASPVMTWIRVSGNSVSALVPMSCIKLLHGLGKISNSWDIELIYLSCRCLHSVHSPEPRIARVGSSFVEKFRYVPHGSYSFYLRRNKICDGVF